MNPFRLLQFTSYCAAAKPIAQPWFGIGPVWGGGPGQHVVGVSVQFGRRGFALHRRIG